MKTEEEINAVNIQLTALIVALLSSIISIIITYNQKLDIEGKKSKIDSSNLFKLTLFNRILIVVLSLVFLYVNYSFYNISKKEGENLKSYILQISASIFALISGLIALYVVSLSNTESIVDVENPII